MQVTCIFSFSHNDWNNLMVWAIFEFRLQMLSTCTNLKCLLFLRLNSLPNVKFLDMAIFKAFADYKLYIAIMTFSLCDRVENTVGKEENAGYQHFLLFPQGFPKPSSIGSLKVGIVW